MENFFSKILENLSASDFYMSLPFWAAFTLVALAFRLAPEKRLLKQVLMLVFSIGMLLMLPRFTWPILVVFTGLCATSYAFGAVLNDNKPAGVMQRKLLAGTGVVAVVCLLGFFKYRFIQEAILAPRPDTGVQGSDFIFLIGISYSSFKAIHFIIDGYKKGIKGGTFLDFLNFMFFFPSFISGPINRFNHFQENSALKKSASLREDLAPGLERIIHGLFKKTVLTTILFPYTLTQLGAIQELTQGQIVLGLYAFAFYSYLDFSGYTDLAIGSARLMGFTLPENFDLPFLKRNIQQLWANWHISLSSWLTDYIYWPLVRKMRKSNALRTHPLLISNLAIIVTFLVCGLWHGEGMNFILWGVYQGVGIAVVNVYQNWKRKVRDPNALKYFRSSFSQGVGVFFTFNFFAVGLMAFALDANQIGIVIRRLLGA